MNGFSEQSMPLANHPLVGSDWSERSPAIKIWVHAPSTKKPEENRFAQFVQTQQTAGQVLRMAQTLLTETVKRRLFGGALRWEQLSSKKTNYAIVRGVNTMIRPVKLYTPLPGPGTLLRLRLLDRLDASISHPLTLLTAGPGYGKSTLVAQWLQQRARPHSWISLDEQDNDPIRFLSHVERSLALANPGAFLETDEAGSGQAEEPVHELHLFIQSLESRLAYLTTPFFLVLDNYQAISSSAIHSGIKLLLDRQPPGLSLLILGRTHPPLALTSLRDRGQVVDLRTSELAFTREEADSYLTDGLGVTLGADGMDILMERTLGWPAGLQLAALALQQREDPAQILDLLATNHDRLFDHLLQDTLDRLPQTGKTFLLHTAILDALHPGLCQALTGHKDSQAWLEAWSEANLFFVRLTGSDGWWGRHPLWTQMLRQELVRREPDLLPALHVAAAEWFQGQDRMEEAVPHLLAAEQWEAAMAGIEETLPDLWGSRQWVQISSWLGRLPEEARAARPVLGLAYIHALLQTGQVDHAYQEAALIESVLDRSAEPALVAGLGEIRSTLAHLRGNVGILAATAVRLMAPAQAENSPARQQAHLNMALADQMRGLVRPAAHLLRPLAVLPTSPEQRELVLLAQSYLADGTLYQGRLRRAAATYEEVIQRSDDRPMWPRIRAHMGLATIYYAWDRLDRAGEQARLALDLAEITQREVMAAPALLVLGQIAQTQGEPERARRLFSQAYARCQRLQHGLYLAQATVLSARLEVQHFDLVAEEALEVLDEHEPAVAHSGLLGQLVLTLARAELALWTGDVTHCLAILEQVTPRMGGLVHFELIAEALRASALQIPTTPLLEAGAVEGYARLFHQRPGLSGSGHS